VDWDPRARHHHQSCNGTHLQRKDQTNAHARDNNRIQRRAQCLAGEPAATDGALSGGLAELLAATYAVVGTERAVAAAVRGLGGPALATGLSHLVQIALTRATQSAVKSQPDGLAPIDLLVQPPPDSSITDLLAMRHPFEQILGRPVDLITYGGLRPGRDDDILREAVAL
jgi:hypothetical protein